MMTDEFSSSGFPTPSVDGAGNSSRRQTLPSLRGEAADSASTVTWSSAAQTLLTGSAAADENQVVVESSDGGNVGGGESVPSSASSSSKPVPDVSIAPPQGPVVVSNTQQKHAKPNAYSNNNYNHGHFNWQKPTVGGGSIGFMRPPPPPPLPPPFPMFEIPYPRPVSNQFSYRNHSRRGRHDQDRDWNGPRDQMVPPPPHAPRGFFALAPQPFGNPMGFGMPPYLYVPPQPMFPVMDGPPLTTLILNQIDYYFSETNLVTDKFLKENMDREGWVPISLIAGFPRMDRLTKKFHLNKEGHMNKLILNSLRNSKVVEVQGDKLRPRKNWERWVATSANGARQGGPSNNSPVIEDATTKPNTMVGLSDGSPSSETVGLLDGSPSSETVTLSDGSPSSETVGLSDGSPSCETVALSDASPSSKTVGLSDASSSSEQQESTTATSKLAEDNCNGNRKKV